MKEDRILLNIIRSRKLFKIFAILIMNFIINHFNKANLSYCYNFIMLVMLYYC
ncbi:MAG: hypothetical protein JWP45_1993 [Mucilaginibacter sp.]|nr:hypothetical protein [Mucilaginibacter sp.]MDB5139402.1 hypothetical protein [Mucilaginibacter sp.]